jgi:translocator protein
MNTLSWYQTLIKPEWAPPAWLFGPVWTVLYILIAISFGAVFIKFFRKELSAKIVTPFALNIISNLAYSPIQFGLKNNILASLDILLILITLVWAMLVIYPRMRWVALVNIPYLLWVSFATILQLTITFLNL